MSFGCKSYMFTILLYLISPTVPLPEFNSKLDLHATSEVSTRVDTHQMQNNSESLIAKSIQNSTKLHISSDHKYCRPSTLQEQQSQAIQTATAHPTPQGRTSSINSPAKKKTKQSYCPSSNLTGMPCPAAFSLAIVHACATRRDKNCSYGVEKDGNNVQKFPSHEVAFRCVAASCLTQNRSRQHMKSKFALVRLPKPRHYMIY